MLRTLIVAACSWLSLVAGMRAVAETSAASTETPSESAKLPVATADLPAAPAQPASTAEHPAATDGASAPDKLRSVKEVTLDPTVKPPVCRRYVPTGSRIATEVCQSAEVADTVRAAERDQTRRDIDEMRMRQATRDAARGAVQAEALRRSAGF